MSTDDAGATATEPRVEAARDRVGGNDLVHAAAREGDVSVAAYLPADASAEEIAAVRARIVSELDQAANRRQQGEADD